MELTSNSFVIVPHGWQRIVDKGRVTYISPDGLSLRSRDELLRHLTSAGTCKCGLRCPFVLDEAFNFDPDILGLPDNLPFTSHTLCSVKPHLSLHKVKRSAPKKPPPKAKTTPVKSHLKGVSIPLSRSPHKAKGPELLPQAEGKVLVNPKTTMKHSVKHTAPVQTSASYPVVNLQALVTHLNAVAAQSSGNSGASISLPLLMSALQSQRQASPRATSSPSSSSSSSSAASVPHILLVPSTSGSKTGALSSSSAKIESLTASGSRGKSLNANRSSMEQFAAAIATVEKVKNPIFQSNEEKGETPDEKDGKEESESDVDVEQLDEKDSCDGTRSNEAAVTSQPPLCRADGGVVLDNLSQTNKNNNGSHLEMNEEEQVKQLNSHNLYHALNEKEESEMSDSVDELTGGTLDKGGSVDELMGATLDKGGSVDELTGGTLDKGGSVDDPMGGTLDKGASMDELTGATLDKSGSVDDSMEEPVHDPIEELADESIKRPADESMERQAEEPIREPTEGPVDKPTEDSVDKPMEGPVNEHMVGSVDEPMEGPVDEPMERPVDEPLEAPVDEPLEGPVDESMEGPVDKPIEAPVDEPLEAPVDEPMEGPVDEPMEGPVDESLEAPVDKPLEAPVDEPLEAPVDEPMEGPVDEPLEAPVNKPIEGPADEGPVDKPMEGPVDQPIKELVDEPMEASVDEPMEGPVDKPMEAPVDEPMEGPVDKSMEGPVDEPMEAPVDEPMEGPVDKPMEGPVDEPIGELTERQNELESEEPLENHNVLQDEKSSHLMSEEIEEQNNLTGQPMEEKQAEKKLLEPTEKQIEQANEAADSEPVEKEPIQEETTPLESQTKEKSNPEKLKQTMQEEECNEQQQQQEETLMEKDDNQSGNKRTGKQKTKKRRRGKQEKMEPNISTEQHAEESSNQSTVRQEKEHEPMNEELTSKEGHDSLEEEKQLVDEQCHRSGSESAVDTSTEQERDLCKKSEQTKKKRKNVSEDEKDQSVVGSDNTSSEAEDKTPANVHISPNTSSSFLHESIGGYLFKEYNLRKRSWTPSSYDSSTSRQSMLQGSESRRRHSARRSRPLTLNTTGSHGYNFRKRRSESDTVDTESGSERGTTPKFGEETLSFVGSPDSVFSNPLLPTKIPFSVTTATEEKSDQKDDHPSTVVADLLIRFPTYQVPKKKMKIYKDDEDSDWQMSTCGHSTADSVEESSDSEKLVVSIQRKDLPWITNYSTIKCRCSMFKIGDIVWAKAPKLPSWPGKIISHTQWRKKLSRAPEGHMWVKWFKSDTVSLVPESGLKDVQKGYQQYSGATGKNKKKLHVLESAMEEAIEALKESEKDAALDI